MNDNRRNERRPLEIPDNLLEMFEMIAGKKKTYVADVVRQAGTGIVLPEGLPLEAAIQVLQRKQMEEEEEVNLHASIDASPYDGAYALYQAMEARYGAVVQKKDFFGSRHNIQVVVDADGTTVSVPWGDFTVPGIEGTITSGHTFESGRIIFQVTAEIKGKYTQSFNDLVAMTRTLVLERSIYRGKSLDIHFTDDRGNQLDMPTIKFVNVSHAMRPIFPAQLEEQLDNDVLAYVKYPEEIRKLRGSLKRGILLAGPYGTGKTLTAGYVAHEANANGFTFIYTVPRDLPHAIEFARLYQPAVIFCEDIETVAAEERSERVNLLLNKLDGVDSKNKDVIVIMTTNHGEKINEAMLRPGRIDVVIQVTEPDAEAAIRIARHYAKGQLAKEDFTQAGQRLAGMIPAVIAEAVSRAQIRATVRTGGKSSVITNDDLVKAAESVNSERKLFEHSADRTEAEEFGNAFGYALGDSIGDAMAHFSANGRHAEPTK